MSAPRRRLAWLSPLAPRRSGVADYSEDLLPSLGEIADVELVVDGYRPSDAVARRFPVLAPDAFRRRTAAYDAVIYQVANNLPDHGYLVPLLAEVPGIVVLHDHCLQYLMLGQTLMRGDLEALCEVLRPAYGDRAPELARRLLRGRVDPLTLSFARPLVDLARGVIVHSRIAAERVRADRADVPVATVAMPVPEVAALPPAGVRARHGLGDTDFILASASGLAHNKRLELVLAALPALRARFPQLKLLVIGGGLLGSRARRFVRRHGLETAVVQTGWVSPETYRDLIGASDLLVDLRHPSAAETSASIARAMAAGRPLVVSAQGTFLELPDAACVRIPVDGSEIESLVRVVGELLPDEPRRRAMGRAARDFVRAHAGPDRVAHDYLAFVEQVIASGAKPRTAGAPWLTAHGSALRRRAVAARFALARFQDLRRHYGLADTLERLRDEVRRRLGAASGGGGAA